MDIKINLDAQAIATAFEKSPDITSTYIRQALLESCRLVQHEARYHHRFTARTGALERAITYRVKKAATEGVIYIDDKVAPYGKFVHTGTRPHDIYPKNKKSLRWATMIGGKQGLSAGDYKKMRLKDGYNYSTGEDSRFRKGSTFAFARFVHHPGTKPDEFLYKAANKNRLKINDIFRRKTDEALQKIGLQ